LRLAPFEILKNKKLAEYRDHPVLFENITHEKFKSMSTAREIPTGAVFVSILGTVFGPKQGV